jgi:hypothetical protein
MAEAAQLRRIGLVMLALSVAGCRWSSEASAGPSVTVQLPPARPAVPQPSFSFGGAPRTVTVPEAKE